MKIIILFVYLFTSNIYGQVQGQSLSVKEFTLTAADVRQALSDTTLPNSGFISIFVPSTALASVFVGSSIVESSGTNAGREIAPGERLDLNGNVRNGSTRVFDLSTLFLITDGNNIDTNITVRTPR